MGTFDTNDTSTSGGQYNSYSSGTFCYNIIISISNTCNNTVGTGWIWGGNYVPPAPEQRLVKVSKRWSKRQVAAFVDLINSKTRTGWKINMIIHGDVELVDKTIAVISMAECRDLLFERDSAADTRKISNFFKSNGGLTPNKGKK